MKRIHLNKYSIAAILFIAAAAVLVAIPLNTSLSEYITAVYVISGMACVMTGIFLLMFSGGEPFDPQLIGILPAQGCMNLCRIAFDLDIHGNAYFIPPRVTGEARVMQFNPTGSYKGSHVSAKEPFPTTGPAGLVTVPSCDPLIQELRRRNALVIPNNEEQITQLLRETITGIFEFAPRVSVHWHDNTVTITFHGYRFIAGCQFIAQESPGCCTKNPCPACSICASLIAEATDKIITPDKCSISASKKDVILICSILSPLDPPAPLRQPTGEGSGSSH
ncbi:MAG: hypothetical protein LUQ36_11490 [Methanoregula sp.]|nr:hypothetical protein [Methanoregula sp.]